MDFTHARTTMVDNQIRTEDVTDWDVLRAFLTVPREDFVPEARRELAYIGTEQPLSANRRMMAPSQFGRLLQLLLVSREDRVLLVGAGMGYAAAILARLSKDVFALEEDAELATKARAALGRAGATNVSVVEGPLGEGWADGAPFDRILFEGAIEVLPEAFVHQLADGGRMVAVEGRGNAAAARLFVKDEGGVSNRFAFNCSIPMLPGFAKAPTFVF